MNVNWYVVANRVLARFFEQTSPRQIKLIGNLDNPKGALKTKELVAGREGRSAGRQSVLSPKVREMHGFARRVVEFLEHSRQQGSFDKIAIIADAQVLGAIREACSTQLDQCIGATLQKNLINVKEQDIIHFIKPALMPTLELSRTI